MKQKTIYEVIEKLKSNPALMRKLKIFVIIGIVGFFVVGGLTIWIGVTAFKYVSGKATEAVQSPSTKEHVTNLKSEVQRLPRIQAASCWSKAQSLLAVQPWLERPALDNLAKLQEACLGPKSKVCEGPKCQPGKEPDSHTTRE